MKNTINKILKADEDGRIEKKITGKDLVNIGIKRGTAWTFLWKHRKGTDYPVNEYFKQNDDGTYSLLGLIKNK